jgi:hypothetical protein
MIGRFQFVHVLVMLHKQLETGMKMLNGLGLSQNTALENVE